MKISVLINADLNSWLGHIPLHPELYGRRGYTRQVDYASITISALRLITGNASNSRYNVSVTDNLCAATIYCPLN